MHTVKRFIRKSPQQKLQTILDLLPGVDVVLYYALQAVGVPDYRPGVFATTVRQGRPEDFPALLRCMDKRERFLSRFDIGDYCLLAFDGDEVVGFLWFSFRDTYTEELTGYHFPVPAKAVYAYDGYVNPNYRQQGVLNQLFTVLYDWMRQHGKDTIISLIAHDNEVSWRANVKRGFIPFKKVLYVRILGWYFLRETLISER